MTEVYSLAICPPQQVVTEVALLKDELAKHINTYVSRHSEAHLTLNVFEASKKELAGIDKLVAVFVRSQSSFVVSLSHAEAHVFSGAYCLLPNYTSTILLKQLIKAFHKNVPMSGLSVHKTRGPHMSIARELSPENLATANQLFSGRIFNISFQCTNLALRKLDADLRQYKVIKRYPFCGPLQYRLFE